MYSLVEMKAEFLKKNAANLLAFKCQTGSFPGMAIYVIISRIVCRKCLNTRKYEGNSGLVGDVSVEPVLSGRNGRLAGDCIN